MSVFGKIRWCAAVLAIGSAALVSCRKPADATKSDLGEAGYQLNAADWFRASRANDSAALKKFIAGGFSVETRDADGDSALHAAAHAGAKDSADFLLDRGLGVDLQGAADRTPLMAAVLGDQTAMVRWLLRQGANPLLKDKEGYVPLMIAVREGKSGSVAELAPYNRENLDSAILLAALLGRTEVIDTLTNYGASVYARMEDGRTPLMVAAENGHVEAVKLLLDLGSGRLSTDVQGRTAADLATAAGHAEIAALISREPLPAELALEPPAEIAKTMDSFVDAAAPKGTSENTPPDAVSHTAATSIQGEVLSAAVDPDSASAGNPNPPSSPAPAGKEIPRLPPLVMRHYREREMPVQVRTVEEDVATLAVSGKASREVKVRAGDTIPGSRLVVLRVHRAMRSGKLNLGNPVEVSIVEVRDPSTGVTREWISGVATTAHDPTALVEDAATGRRYTAAPGQRFKSADGTEFIVSEVRPNQIVIEDAATRAVKTIPLRGPRG